MFFHNLKYSLKILFRNKILIFWTFAFPIILGTLFNMAFSNISENEKLKIIDIAIVKNDEFDNNMVFKQIFEELGNPKSEDQLFNIKYTTKEKAKKLLENDEIDGYMYLKDNIPQIVIVKNGINQTIFQYVTEEIWQNINSSIQITEQVKTNIKDISNKNLDYTMIEYYTLIAMTALYGGVLSMSAINNVIPNISNKGKRISVSNTKKSIIIFSNLIASYIVQIIGLIITFLYTIFILKVDYGENIGLVIVLAFIGSLAGLALGLFIGSVLKVSENSKIGILIGFTMLCCYFSGMMGITMKYIIDKNIPIINKLNPASIITDGFYALYYYDTLNRYVFDIVSLIIFASILIIVSSFVLRRQKYDSI